MAEADPGVRRLPLRALVLYALAWGGGAIAYVPFLTILLPVRVERLAGHENSVAWLAYIAFAGAIAASVGHIAFGYLSDITRRRRVWILLGLVLSCLLLVAVSQATGLASLLTVIVLWQLALNMMLAPLGAWAGDGVPDSQKGLLGGLLAFAPALGALSGALVTWPDLASADLRLVLVAGIVAICVLPLVVLAPMREGPGADELARIDHSDPPRFLRSGLVRRMWLARLAVQIAEAALFAYLYLWLRSLDPGLTDSRSAQVFSTVLFCSAPLAVAVGHWADRRGKPLLPLVASALVSACGLLLMALVRDVTQAFAAYALFGLASAVFLALHSAQTLRVLPRPERRGRDLGLFNLTNTGPSLIMPWLVLLLVPQFGFGAMFLLLAGLAMTAGAILTRLPQQN